MSKLYFILIAIIFPLLSVLSFILSLLTHIQTERTRKQNTKALRRLRLGINTISGKINEPLIQTEDKQTETLEQTRSSSPSPSLTPSSPSPLPPHMLSYAQETSLLTHLTSLLQSRLPYLPVHRVSAIITDFGNSLKEWRHGEGRSVESLEAMERLLQYKLLMALLDSETSLTSGQSAGILDEFGMRFRDVYTEGSRQGSGSDGHQELEGGNEVEESREREEGDLVQNWSGDTLVRRGGEDMMPMLMREQQ